MKGDYKGIRVGGIECQMKIKVTKGSRPSIVCIRENIFQKSFYTLGELFFAGTNFCGFCGFGQKPQN